MPHGIGGYVVKCGYERNSDTAFSSLISFSDFVTSNNINTCDSCDPGIKKYYFPQGADR